MIRVTKKRKKSTRRLYGLFFLFFLSAAAGVGLYKLSPSLLDIGRNFRQAADKILEQSADIASAEPVLRGTVFDRNLKELAVSYRLYSLYVRPAEVTDTQDVVRILSDITGQDQAHISALLNEAKNIINVAEHLEQGQVDMIKNAQLPGLYIKPVEERFYPEHETAASLIGFTGKGIGLSGVEGIFDTLLQDGEFRTETISGIDFREEQVLGRAKLDVVLTVDLEMQKRIEKKLKGFLDTNQVSRGIVLLMDPTNGAVLSWASQPSFNPNYYWKIEEKQRKSLFEENLDPNLVRRLRVRIAAIRKNGDSGDFLLPETVAMDDYGLEANEIEQLGGVMGPNKNVECLLPSCGSPPASLGSMSEQARNDAINPVEWAKTVSSMINGGWVVSPYILDAVYNHGRDKVYASSVNNINKERVFSPSMGIRVRHDLATSFSGDDGNMILQADSIKRVKTQQNISEHVIQEVLLGAIPAKSPKMLLLMVTQQDNLNPFPQKSHSDEVSIKAFGKQLLTSIFNEEQKRGSDQQTIALNIPKGPDSGNYNQFLISSRIDYQERSGRGAGRVEVMPQLVGLSLRKGLQRVNEYNLQVKIQGSGQIVSQVPGPGEPLQGVGECVLTLASEI
jgi:cell division protein FtsI (penicillin-binding protein 3)